MLSQFILLLLTAQHAVTLNNLTGYQTIGLMDYRTVGLTD